MHYDCRSRYSCTCLLFISTIDFPATINVYQPLYCLNFVTKSWWHCFGKPHVQYLHILLWLFSLYNQYDVNICFFLLPCIFIECCVFIYTMVESNHVWWCLLFYFRLFNFGWAGRVIRVYGRVWICSKSVSLIYLLSTWFDFAIILLLL